MAKYVMRIEAIESFSNISRGNGGFWEDRGYEWYAGIWSDLWRHPSLAGRRSPWPSPGPGLSRPST